MPEAFDQQIMARLSAVRHAMLRLHKTLLDGERARYEREHGRVDSTGRLLELVLNNPSFDWLHRLSELIVQIDQAMEDKDAPLTAAGAQEFLQRAGELLTPSETGDLFARKYFDALQSDPAVGVAHGELRKMLR